MESGVGLSGTPGLPGEVTARASADREYRTVLDAAGTPARSLSSSSPGEYRDPPEPEDRHKRSLEQDRCEVSLHCYLPADLLASAAASRWALSLRVRLGEVQRPKSGKATKY